MTNEQLIKSGHVWALAVLLACGVIAVAASGLRTDSQNSNQNSNSQNSNQNSGSSMGQNQNSTRNSNSRSGENATGSQVGSSSLSSDDRKFAMEAAMGGMLEVELGRLATQQGASAAVKQFGQRMVDDHSKANDELKQVASTKGIALPTELDEKHKDQLAKMQKMTGADFDKAYSKAMLSDHVKDVAAFEKQSTKGGDADLKAFASKTLPTLQEHLQMVRALNGQGNNGSKSSNSNSTGSKNSNSNSTGAKNSNSNN